MKNYLTLYLAAGMVFFMNTACSAKTAVATLQATQENSTVSGKVSFEEVSEGLRVRASLEGVPPGKHGFHIHEKGDCGDQGKSAGGHFNPDGMTHGNMMKGGFAGAHAGDFGNIEIGEDGKGSLDFTAHGLTLDNGKYGVLGRSLILHEKEDDYSQPTGNAGSRIGCGEIQAE